MRLKQTALASLFPVVALLSGCAMQNQGSPSAPVSASKPITGKAFGGQQPVAGATIALYTFGAAGYGSPGTLLATATTDSGGFFNIDPASINCPTASTPVYILSLGGYAIPGQYNAQIVLGSGLGPCGTAANAFVTINEVSTAALAYTLSNFFSGSTNDGTTSDHFGSPAGSTQVISTVNNGTLPTLLDVQNGYPHPSSSSFTFEGGKLLTVANIIGGCVNSGGTGSPGCDLFFSETTPASGIAPTDTLQAAVEMALNPTQNVAALFALQPQSGAQAFTGGLTSPPSDWTLSASYTSPSFGLGVNTRTVTTIDVDQSGRVWFPSNSASAAGVGYFDPGTGFFSPLFTAGLVHPQQVAINRSGVVWANDMSSTNIAGFPSASPSYPAIVPMPGITTALAVGNDNTLRVAYVDPGTNQPSVAQVSSSNTVTPVPNSTLPGSSGYIGASLAADVLGGYAGAGTYLPSPTTYDIYYYPDGSITPVTYQSFQDAGQVAFTGTDYVGARGGYDSNGDGICIWTAFACYGMANAGQRHPSGLALDGAGALWLADNNGPMVEFIPHTNGSYLNGSNLANNTVILHDSRNGSTLINPAGIAVDGAGNVWVSNYGCYGNGCTPGSFTLSEIIGAATPALTPVSNQVPTGAAGSEPQFKLRSGPKQ